MTNAETILARLEGLSGRVGRMDDRQRQDCEIMRKDISEVHKEVAGLKVKASVWGALAGLVPAVLVLFLLAVRLLLAGE